MTAVAIIWLSLTVCMVGWDVTMELRKLREELREHRKKEGP